MADKAPTTLFVVIAELQVARLISPSAPSHDDVDSESARAENFVTSLTCVSLKVSYFTDDAVQKFPLAIQAGEASANGTLRLSFICLLVCD